MRKELIERVYGGFNALSAERQTKEIDKVINSDEIFFYYELAGIDYQEKLQELVKQLEKDNFNFDEKQFTWEQSSQGWYFERGNTCYLAYTFEDEVCNIDFEFSLYDIDKKIDLVNIQSEKFTDAQIEKMYNKQIEDIFNKAIKYNNELHELIDEFVYYHPTIEEIKQDLIDNVEFIISEKVVG